MSWWQRLFGDRDRLGWWTLPVFVVVALTGAVLAGALATVWYGQQVDALEDETAAGRQELRDAVEDVRAAGEEALDAIASEVDAVRQSLDRDLPFDDVVAHGIVSVQAGIGPQHPAPSGDDQPQGAALQDEGGETEPDDEQPPQPTYRELRRGTGFAVAQEGEVMFVATTFSLVADPDTSSGVSEAVEVTTPDGTFPAAVHSWDERRDLVLLRTELGGIEILEWRPAGEELAIGARLVVAGVTPNLQGIQIAGVLAFVDVDAMITDLPRIELLTGAPIVDDRGHVVAIYSTRYAPFGAGAGQASVPARLLCERMLRNCEALEADTGGASPTEDG
ncbi:MAG: trypsin-like peptidase domain-containing protein [Nitriliruptorales bacterium]|nr:trypsin-like peptidase domain-containing protein [Nitriliruptorales bacterium]